MTWTYHISMANYSNKNRKLDNTCNYTLSSHNSTVQIMIFYYLGVRVSQPILCAVCLFRLLSSLGLHCQSQTSSWGMLHIEGKRNVTMGSEYGGGMYSCSSEEVNCAIHSPFVARFLVLQCVAWFLALPLRNQVTLCTACWVQSRTHDDVIFTVIFFIPPPSQ